MATDRKHGSIRTGIVFAALLATLGTIWATRENVRANEAERATAATAITAPDTMELLVFTGTVVSYDGRPCVVRRVSRAGDEVTLDVRCRYREVAP